MYTLVRRSFFAFVFFIFLLQTSSAYAEEKKAQQIVCLQAVRCDAKNSPCSNNGIPVHRVYLSSDPRSPSRPNTKTYIVECVSTSQGQICTTGNADTAADVGWETSLTELKKLTGYTFEGVYDKAQNQVDQLKKPFTSDSRGAIPSVEWQSRTNGSTYHTFYALNIFEPTTSSATNSATQKQGTFDFVPGSTGCTSVRWDPYGVIFDGETLEPIPDVQVRLYEKKASGFVSASIVGVENPIVTSADGAFNFIIPDGIYKLSVTTPHYFLLPTDATKINSNYKKVYSDLYYSEPQTEEIHQTASVAQHRDIPLIPRQSGLGTYPLTVMDYYQYVDTLNGVLVIKGKVSHPLTKIKVYTTPLGSSTKARELPLQFTADKMGLFSAEITLSSIPSMEAVGGLEFEKTELTKNISLGQNLNIYTLPIQPILTNIDGFAYDKRGKLLPKAGVEIYLPFSKTPYYKTEADEQGHFTMSQQNLPSMPYILVYTLNDTTTELDTQTFLNQNANYIQSTGVNPLVPKNIPTPTIASTPSSNASRITPPPPRYQSVAYGIVIIIILCFGVIGVLLGFHLIERGK